MGKVEEDRVIVGSPRLPTFNTPPARLPWKLEAKANKEEAVGEEVGPPRVRLMGAKEAKAHPGEFTKEA